MFRLLFLLGFGLVWLVWADAARAAQTLPPTAWIVDDDVASESPDFLRGGPTAYWRNASLTGTAYYSGSMVWTFNNTNIVENYAYWYLPLSATVPMSYEVFAFIPAYNATTRSAQYQVAHAGLTQTRSIDQNAFVAEWVSLGSYSFTTHSTSYVLLTDVTGEPSGARQVGFDAFAFVPIAATVEPRPPPVTNPITFTHSAFVPVVMNGANGLLTSTSRYVSTINPQAHYGMGCESGRNGEGGTIILDFGQPQQVGFGYGTLIFDFTTLASTSQIADAAKAFLRGYEDCAPNYARLNLAIGTSNFRGTTNFEHGRAWAQLVNTLNTWLSATSLFEGEGLGVRSVESDRFAFLGANDIEPSWNTVTNTRNWVQGYASAALHPYLNYGSCDGCPSAQFPNWQPNNGWSLDDIWFVSQGARIARPFPEIYATNGIHAHQWQWVNVYAAQQKGERMRFAGVLTQWQACQQTAPVQCRDDGLDNTPQQGWQLMQAALNSDEGTAQPLPPPSDISWRSVPVSTTWLSNRLSITDGLIISDVQAPLPAQTFIAKNLWLAAQANGETLLVFAGSVRDPEAGGHDSPQGAVAVLVWGADGAFDRKRTLILRAPTLMPALHVQRKEANVLVLATDDGEQVTFSLAQMNWRSDPSTFAKPLEVV
jgi:hypothetical protein